MKKNLTNTLSFILAILFLLANSMPVYAGLADSLIIHGITAMPNEEGTGYTVEINVSVLDNDKNPVEGLTLENFVVTEDSNQVVIDDVNLSRNLPISVIVLMDNSGSMLGERLRLAKQGIGDFIDSLGGGDQVAAYTFSEVTRQIVVFTDDVDEAAQDWNNSTIAADKGTCLYNAIYGAVEQAKPLSQGRRAVVVLSDGKDTITGYDVCSSYTEQDVIDKANEGGALVPVYTIGVGNEVDEKSLERIANRTGGVYNHTISNNELPALFDKLSDQLSSEYIVSYTSTAAPGTHSITVNVGGEISSKQVNFPGLPPVVSFAYPSDGQMINPETSKVTLSILDRGMSFSSLSFAINGALIGISGKAFSPPYEYDIDFSQYNQQEITLGVLILDANGVELSSAEITIFVGMEPVPTESDTGEITEVTPTPEETPSSAVTPCPDELVCIGNFSIRTLYLILIGVAIAALIISIVVFSKLKKTKVEKKAPISLFDEDATFDGISAPYQQLGVVTIIKSDDSMMNGREYKLMKNSTSIGRSVSNDISLPNDSAVSRTHVRLVYENGKMYLREEMKVASNGTKTPPTYGTFYKGRKIDGEVALSSGDEFKLGDRTTLRYESAGLAAPAVDSDSEDVTMDNVRLPKDLLGDDETVNH